MLVRVSGAGCRSGSLQKRAGIPSARARARGSGGARGAHSSRHTPQRLRRSPECNCGGGMGGARVRRGTREVSLEESGRAWGARGALRSAMLSAVLVVCACGGTWRTGRRATGAEWGAQRRRAATGRRQDAAEYTRWGGEVGRAGGREGVHRGVEGAGTCLGIRLRKRSWPAVSHSCSRTVRFSRYMVFERKSMPIVAFQSRTAAARRRSALSAQRTAHSAQRTANGKR